MKDLLGLLTATYGPSGNEDPIREVIENEIKDYVDELSTEDVYKRQDMGICLKLLQHGC